MKKIIFFLIAFICTTDITNAGVFRAGGITYSWMSGLTYEFTLVTITDSISYPEAVIECGDGTWDTLSLTNVISLPNGVKRNEYIATHTYPGIGVYFISFESPNRIEGIVNIPNSVDVPFFVKSKLVINPSLGNNNLAILNNLLIDTALLGQMFIFNPGAYDVDGDSLVYFLDICKGEDGLDIPGYTLPPDITFDINSGDFVWNSPQIIGYYNFAIRIEEYRNGVFIGNVIQEIQFIVTSGTGLNDYNSTSEGFIFYPNPFAISTSLQLSKPLQSATLSIYDILGKEVKRFNNLNGTEFKISSDGMKNGMYFFTVNDAKGFVGNGKMVVE